MVSGMSTTGGPGSGELPTRYGFIMNPYPEMRLANCPICNRKTGQRKLPLLIHVEPKQLVALNYTCRYCRHCDLLVAHKHEIEHLLYGLFLELDSGAIGNDYLVYGTLEKAHWRESTKRPMPPAEALKRAFRFETCYEELRCTQAGWYPRGQKPPMMEPPPSREWVRADRRSSPGPDAERTS